MQERLQKIISRAGYTSRRKAEELIVGGRVTVNGKQVMELGAKADFEQDHIKVDGKLLHPPKSNVYIAMYKPKGVITSVHDPEGRETVMDFIPKKDRVFPVGRLDYQSEGLLILTNDGEMANRMTRTAHELEKTYHAKANGFLTEEQLEEFRSGVPLFGKRTAPAQIRLLSKGENPWYEVRLIEGRNNQIRFMFKYFDLLVEKLRRVKIGFLDLKPLKPAEFRYLTAQEVGKFQRLLGMEVTVADERPRRAKKTARKKQDHSDSWIIERPTTS